MIGQRRPIMANYNLRETHLSPNRGVHLQFLGNHRMRTIVSTMQVQLGIKEDIQVITWNEKILSLLGLWPQHRNDFRFFLIIAYLIFHVSLQWVDLFEFINDFKHVVENSVDNIPFTATILKLIILRENSRKIGKLMDAIEEDLNIGIDLTLDEKKAFQKYNKRSRIFTRIIMPSLLFTGGLYSFKPLVGQLFIKAGGNASLTFEMPHKIHLLHDVTDSRTYFVTYACLLPLTFITVFAHVAVDCLLATLTLHICSQLSILTIRIRNMRTYEPYCNYDIRSIVEKHVRLKWIAHKMQGAFSNILLQLLFETALGMCITGYHATSNLTKEYETESVVFAACGVAFLLLLCGHCIVGECLIHESEKVYESFCACDWHKLPIPCMRTIVICMALSKKPMSLSAGNIFTLSLENFTHVLRTSFGFLSVLKTLL